MLAEPKRYHALDSLRAVMMLLGVYLHVIVCYSPIGGWPFKDPQTSSAFLPMLVFVHIFRMPIFFVMAGFFAALLYSRRGAFGLAANRAKRILLPGMIFWVVLFIIVSGLATYAHFSSQPDPIGASIAYLTTGDFLHKAFPMHLWFMLYLVYLCAAFLLVAGFVRLLLPSAVERRCDLAFRAAVTSKARVFLFAVPSFAALCLMHFADLETPQGWLPVPRILFAYALFFGFGWVLYANSDLLDSIRDGAWRAVIGGCVTAGLNWYFFSLQMQAAPRFSAEGFYGSAATNALTVWFFVFGFTGLFLRYLDRPIPVMRYLSDSAYWIYLAHVPVLMALQMVLMPYAWPALVKAAIVLAFALPVLVLSYHFMVRSTFLGVLLNGRRYGKSALCRPGQKGDQPAEEGAKNDAGKDIRDMVPLQDHA